MKKYLSIICAVLTLAVFTSCGNNVSNSENLEIPKSSTSETTIEEETELKTSTEKDNFITIPDLYGMDYDEAVEEYGGFFEILSSGREENELKPKSIISQDIEAGTVYKSDGNRPRIYVRLSSGKRNNAIDGTTTQKTTEQTNEPIKLTDSYVAKGAGNHSTGISIGYNSEWKIRKELNDTETTITYTMEIPDKCEIVCRYILAPPSLLSGFAYAPNNEWIEKRREKHPNSSVKTNANGYDFLFYTDNFNKNIFECSNGYTAFKMTVTKLSNSWEEIEDIQRMIFDSIDIIDSYELPKEEATEPSVIETANSFETFTISGTGSAVIKDVNIPAEFVVYNAIHNGTSNFIANFYDCNNRRESLVNEIGNYNCTQIFDATDIDDSSSGMVEVDADGDWSITFSPVKSVVSNETSTSFSGYGANITGSFRSTGNMICTISHDGSSNFIVHAYELAENGDKQFVANEIGEYNGQCVIKTKKDVLYLFNVESDGNWTINVE